MANTVFPALSESVRRLAERVTGLYITELIRPRDPWQNFEEGGYATLAWVNGHKNRRLLATIGNTPAVRFEETCYEQDNCQAVAA